MNSILTEQSTFRFQIRNKLNRYNKDFLPIGYSNLYFIIHSTDLAKVFPVENFEKRSSMYSQGCTHFWSKKSQNSILYNLHSIEI